MLYENNKAETLKMNKKQGLFKIKRIGGKILSKTSRNKPQYTFSIAEEGISDLEYIPEEIFQNSHKRMKLFLKI